MIGERVDTKRTSKIVVGPVEMWKKSQYPIKRSDFGGKPPVENLLKTDAEITSINVKPSARHGLGVFCWEILRRGDELGCVLCGTDLQDLFHPVTWGRVLRALGTGEIHPATYRELGRLGRYANHSTIPNLRLDVATRSLYGTLPGLLITAEAVADIPIDTELTVDYHKIFQFIGGHPAVVDPE